MIRRWYDGTTFWCEIHCGCCGAFFIVPVGGSCFCQQCIEASHPGCKVPEIMHGIKK